MQEHVGVCKCQKSRFRVWGSVSVCNDVPAVCMMGDFQKKYCVFKQQLATKMQPLDSDTFDLPPVRVSD